MVFNFKGKVVLITGASRGLGRTIAVQFAKVGANVVVTARDKNSLSDVGSQLSRESALYSTHSLDVTSYKSCEEAINETLQKFGEIDYIINNASSYLTGWDLRSISPDEIENEINGTYRSVVFITKAILPHFIEKKAGTIITVASRSGLIHETSSDPVYAADKSAVIRFSEVMNNSLSEYGIRVCCVVPCAIREENWEKEQAVSHSDVAHAIMMQCVYGDNINTQTMVLRPRKVTPRRK